MPDDDAAELMRRAAALRALASRVQACRARSLFRRAGADTWVGPTPTRCLDELVATGRSLTLAADDLAATARRLEIEAATKAALHAAPSQARSHAPGITVR